MRIVREGTGQTTVTLYDLEPTPDRLCEDVAACLDREPRKLPPKYFYDEAGARLFERIMELEAYYPTRTEIGILERNAAEIAARIGPRVSLVEFGSGSGDKTWILLRHLRDPAAYVPVDISRAQLVEFALSVAEAFPDLAVLPVCADYTAALEIPPETRLGDRTVAFFPGSTLGNFEQADAAKFLRRVRGLVGPEGGMLIGLDLRKDPEIIERAYNDPEGVTAEFNLNLLARINRECGGDFDLSAFEHQAVFDDAEGRIEMRLVSRHDQTVSLREDPDDPARRSYAFARGEYIVTEYSHKFELESFAALARQCGWEVDAVWKDERDWFAVVLLR